MHRGIYRNYNTALTPDRCPNLAPTPTAAAVTAADGVIPTPVA